MNPIRQVNDLKIFAVAVTISVLLVSAQVHASAELGVSIQSYQSALSESRRGCDLNYEVIQVNANKPYSKLSILGSAGSTIHVIGGQEAVARGISECNAAKEQDGYDFVCPITDASGRLLSVGLGNSQMNAYLDGFTKCNEKKYGNGCFQEFGIPCFKTHKRSADPMDGKKLTVNIPFSYQVTDWNGVVFSDGEIKFNREINNCSLHMNDVLNPGEYKSTDLRKGVVFEVKVQRNTSFDIDVFLMNRQKQILGQIWCVSGLENNYFSEQDFVFTLGKYFTLSR